MAKRPTTPAANEKRQPVGGQRRLEAGAAGAGSGTLLVLLAKNLADSNPWKSWLVILAPTLSVGFGAIFAYARCEIDRAMAAWRFSRAVKRAEATVSTALTNQTISEENRLELKSELEKLRMLRIRKDLDPIKLLANE